MSNEIIPMKVLDMRTKSAEKAYVTRSPEDTHSKDELDAVHRAVRYTQLFKQEESLAKMDEEEKIERSMPEVKRLFERQRK